MIQQIHFSGAGKLKVDVYFSLLHEQQIIPQQISDFASYFPLKDISI